MAQCFISRNCGGAVSFCPIPPRSNSIPLLSSPSLHARPSSPPVGLSSSRAANRPATVSFRVLPLSRSAVFPGSRFHLLSRFFLYTFRSSLSLFSALATLACLTHSGSLSPLSAAASLPTARTARASGSPPRRPCPAVGLPLCCRDTPPPPPPPPPRFSVSPRYLNRLSPGCCNC